MSASLMLLGAIAATSSAPTQAPLPHLKRRRRSHEPSSLSVVNIVPTGTPRERRQRIFKEFLASGHSPGKGTAGFFAHKINAYVATHPDAADGDLHFERGSMGNYLAAADKTRVSRHKVGACRGTRWARKRLPHGPSQRLRPTSATSSPSTGALWPGYKATVPHSGSACACTRGWRRPARRHHHHHLGWRRPARRPARARWPSR